MSTKFNFAGPVAILAILFPPKSCHIIGPSRDNHHNTAKSSSNQLGFPALLTGYPDDFFRPGAGTNINIGMWQAEQRITDSPAHNISLVALIGQRQNDSTCVFQHAPSFH
ncbi:hypothetical protein SDC9_154179 [bioreactor metagenome]|uniref:Uncharacterized protein n=1 Tax=bioreactor metagenome TaxID=1076179 RepID=A0A645F093_9ZZZZ